MRYPVVLLDVGETLIGPRTSYGDVYARVVRSLGVDLPVEAIEAGMRTAWDELDRFIPPGVDRYGYFPGGEHAYWRRFAKRALGVAACGALPEGLIERALPRLRRAFLDGEAWTVYDDVPEALETLRRTGVRLGVVSNWDSRLPAILSRLGLRPHFETVVVSHLEGIEKPDPALFRRALDRMGADPATALYVGDRPELDLEGARRAGIDAVLVDRREKLSRELPVIRDLRVLPELARGIS